MNIIYYTGGNIPFSPFLTMIDDVSLVDVNWNDIRNKPDFSNIFTTSNVFSNTSNTLANYNNLYNKPDLSIYSTSAHLSNIFTTSNVLSNTLANYNNLFNIPDLSIYSTSAQSSNIFTTSNVLSNTSNTLANYNNLFNRPDLSIYSTSAQLSNIFTTSNVLSNTSNTIANYNNLFNRPDLSIYSTSAQLSNIFTTSNVLSNTSNTIANYNNLFNRPDLSIYSTSAQLSNIFTTSNVLSNTSNTIANYNNLFNKPDLSIYSTSAQLSNIFTTSNVLSNTSNKIANYNNLFNKPDLSIYSTSAQLSNIFTTSNVLSNTSNTIANYNNLFNKPDLSIFYTKTQNDTLLSSKQNTLNSTTVLSGIGSNLTSINYNSLSNLPSYSITNATGGSFTSNGGVVLSMPTSYTALSIASLTSATSIIYKGAEISSTYLKLSGGTITGDLIVNSTSPIMNIKGTSETDIATLYLATPFSSSSASKCALIAQGLGSSSRSKFHIALNNVADNTSPTNDAGLADSVLTLNYNGNLGLMNTNPIDDGGTYLNIGDSSVANNNGALIIHKRNSTGNSRHHKFGMNSNFHWCIGDFGNNNIAGSWINQIFCQYQAPSMSLFISLNGNITAYGTFLTGSDQKLKTDIRTIDNALWKVQQLRGVYYTHSIEQTKNIGLLAQEVEGIVPEVVVYDETTDVKSVCYQNLVALLVNAIKEQQDIIDNQANQIKNIINILNINNIK